MLFLERFLSAFLLIQNCARRPGKGGKIAEDHGGQLHFVGHYRAMLGAQYHFVMPVRSHSDRASTDKSSRCPYVQEKYVEKIQEMPAPPAAGGPVPPSVGQFNDCRRTGPSGLLGAGLTKSALAGYSFSASCHKLFAISWSSTELYFPSHLHI